VRGPGHRAPADDAPLAAAAAWLASRRVAVEIALIGLLPVIFELWLLADVMPREWLGVDFRYAFHPAAVDVLNGTSPFPPPGDPSITREYAYVYPPLIAILLTPVAIVPALVASIGAILALAACLCATLWLLGVRDWRCYTIVFAWAPVHDGLFTASVSIALALLLALAWRYRDHATRGGLVLGLACSVKLFLAPMLVWPLMRRRSRVAAMATSTALALVFVPWAAIGFVDISWYPRLLGQVTRLEQTEGYSLLAAFAAMGMPVVAARVCSLVIGIGLLASCWTAARRGEQARSLTLAILASLAFSPIVWEHYWVVLIVPLALARPRFSPAWLLPIVLWIGLFTRDYAGGRAAAVGVAALFGALLVLWQPPAARIPRGAQVSGGTDRARAVAQA
jgi:hypothetical protein